MGHLSHSGRYSADGEDGHMNEDKETSKSGADILRHEARDAGFRAPETEARNLACVEAHLERFVGPVDTVLHELVSDRIHLDLLHIAPTDERPFQVVVTSGMSDLPMQVPEDMAEFARAELLVALPPDWPLDQEALANENHYWPLRWLKQVARLPHDYDTWVGWGHSIPNGDPAQPIADTGFTGVCLAPPYWLDPEFFQLKAKSGDTVCFFDLVPVYAAEMQLKLDQGFAELESRFEEANIGFVLDKDRPNVGT